VAFDQRQFGVNLNDDIDQDVAAVNARLDVLDAADALRPLDRAAQRLEFLRVKSVGQRMG